MAKANGNEAGHGFKDGKAPPKIVMASELTALEDAMPQAANAVTARHVTLEDFLKLFDESIHGHIRSAALKPGMTHVVCLENLDMWSSQFGHRSALAVGHRPEGAEIPTWTIGDVLKTPYFRLGDVPSRFQYPVAYASVVGLRDALPPQGQVVGAPADKIVSGDGADQRRQQ